MNQKAITIAAVLGLTIIAGIFIWKQSNSVEQQRERLTSRFMQVLPSSLEDYHREEIEQLFDRFWIRSEKGSVAQEDIDVIVANLKQFVDKKSITIKDLDYLMAEVGYFTFRSVERLNLADGVVDHPVLNPSAAIVTPESDSSFYAGFEEWKKTLPDSVLKAAGEQK